MNKIFRTAIVGNLQALNVLLPAFQAVPAFKVVALCGRNQKRILSVASRAGVSKTFGGWEPLIHDKEIDVVALALPPRIQSDAAVQLAKAGKHLFCEKPLAASLEGAKAVCDSVAGNKRIAVVNFGFRMVEAFRDFHAIVQSGVLGKPEFVMVEWLLSNRRDPTLTWNWKSDASEGGGTLNLVGAHVLDYLDWFFGEISEIWFCQASLLSSRPEMETASPKPVHADDTCNVLLTLSTGVHATASISTVLSVPQNHRVRVWFEKGLLELANAPGDDYHDGFRLCFEPGKGSDRSLNGEVERQAEFSKMSAQFPGKIEISRRVVEQFKALLFGDKCSAVTLEEALKVQKYLHLAIHSI